MNKIVLIAGSIALAGTATAAFALPERPINAANTWNSNHPDDDRNGWGTGCGVTDGATFAFDPECRWQIMYKPANDGGFGNFYYQDSGQLQPGQTPPQQTLILDHESSDAIGTCKGKEIIKPSGEYSSFQHCRPH